MEVNTAVAEQRNSIGRAGCTVGGRGKCGRAKGEQLAGDELQERGILAAG
jgi:hypothetical protein